MSNQLPPHITDLLLNNTEPMVNNFNKIVSWLLHGQQSEHKMPPALTTFLEDYAGVKQQAQETEAKLNTALGLVESLNTALVEQQKVIDELRTNISTLSEQAVTDNADEPKAPRKRAKKADEPVQDAQPVAEQDAVTITAEAVGAGEVDAVGLGEIASMIDNVLGGTPSSTPAMASL